MKTRGLRYTLPSVAPEPRLGKKLPQPPCPLSERPRPHPQYFQSTSTYLHFAILGSRPSWIDLRGFREPIKEMASLLR